MSAPITIMVVDDDVDIRDALSDMLDDFGHPVVTARNGREAIDQLQSDPLPSLILLDLMMPVMDGYEFLEAKRKDARIASIPVAILTAARSPDLARIGQV